MHNPLPWQQRQLGSEFLHIYGPNSIWASVDGCFSASKFTRARHAQVICNLIRSMISSSSLCIPEYKPKIWWSSTSAYPFQKLGLMLWPSKLRAPHVIDIISGWNSRCSMIMGGLVKKRVVRIKTHVQPTRRGACARSQIIRWWEKILGLNSLTTISATTYIQWDAC